MEIVNGVAKQACISAVNHGEVIGHLVRKGLGQGEIDSIVATLGLPIIAVDEALAREAGLMWAVAKTAGLSLADRFCLALARRLDVSMLTSHRIWQAIAAAVGIEVRLIR